MPKRVRDVSPPSTASSDEGTRRVRAKQSSRRKELAALLADQHKHSTSQEMHELQSYVRTVLDGGGDGPAGGRTMQRAVRVAALPDMFGVVHDGRSNSRRAPTVGTGGGGPRRAEAGGGAHVGSDDATDTTCSVLDAAFHRSRWRLVCFPNADPSSFHWVKSTPLEGSNRQVQSLDRPEDEGDEEDADVAALDDEIAGKSQALVSEALALRRFHTRRALEDRHSEAEFEAYLMAQRGLLDHRADAVQFTDAHEYAALVAYLRGAVKRLAARGATTGTTPHRDMMDAIASNVAFLGHDNAACMLQWYGDTRTMVVACDRWEAHVAANLAQYDGPMLSTTSVSECIVVMTHGLVAMRSEATERNLLAREASLTAAASASGTSDVRASLLRLLRMHPFGLLRCAEMASHERASANARREAVGAQDEATGDGCGRGASLALQHDDAWLVLMALLQQERDRRGRRSAYLEAQSSANIPLQRQEAKLSEYTQALAALCSKLESAEIELSVEYLDEELELQLEQSRRLEEAVHSGVMLHEQLASEPCSFLMESALWTLPPTMASLQHREIEEALEKYLWNHPYALMNDELGTLAYVNSIRRQLLVNMVLRRAMTRKGTLLLAMRKLEAELQATVEADSEDGVPLPKA